ncbi:hypothetical protein D3C78_1266250 [compost metagenome]
MFIIKYKRTIASILVFTMMMLVAQSVYAASGNDGHTGYQTVHRENTLLYTVEVSNWHWGYIGPPGYKEHVNINVWTLAGYVHVVNVHMYKDNGCWGFYESKSNKNYKFCGNPVEGLKKFFSELSDIADRIADYLGLAVTAGAVITVLNWALRIILGIIVLVVVP